MADPERSRDLFGNGRLYGYLAAGSRKACLIEHRNDRMRRIAIEPLGDRAARGIEYDAEPAEGPAIVSHRDEETRRESVERADLAADQRHFAAKAHWSDVEGIHGRHD